MSNTHSAWLGYHVSLKIQVGELRVPLRGLVVNGSSNALRVRIEGCWDLDIFKEMIVRVEADKYGAPRPGLRCALENEISNPRVGL